ncbi:MAG: hypothetical protein PHX44_06690 [Sulfurimonas sp.]|uniref:hypothetical protein n=1 Tax=Sulfurimonas sp. TaxID=2022749 RepID=UPI00260B7587|nr:hypothetical protein [Sulfurimonas sp.]MDD2652718.1 hypothetical protein [Sulfurimonas sp.]MDD3450648.1 hypothetical protein [Sulfurimonas sp.]
MKTLSLLLISFSIVFFSACSSKEVYKPIKVVGDWKHAGDSDVVINAVSQDAAMVEKRNVFAGGKVLDVTVAEGEKLLGFSDGWVISSNIDGNVTLQSTQDKKVEKFNLKKTVAAASISGDTLAVLFADNEMALYSLASKTLLLKEQGNPPIVVNSKLIKPYFRDDLVIFATLDGKVVIVNTQTKKRLRTIIVSSEEHFNNVIYFGLLDNKIIAATAHKILSLSKEEVRAPYDIRGVVADDKTLYIATKQGEIISLSSDLKQNAKLKFPFAHFLGLIVSGEKLYALEKEAYLIEMPKDLSSYSVYEADVEDGYVYINDKTFFVHDEYISVEK